MFFYLKLRWRTVLIYDIRYRLLFIYISVNQPTNFTLGRRLNRLIFIDYSILFCLTWRWRTVLMSDSRMHDFRLIFLGIKMLWENIGPLPHSNAMPWNTVQYLPLVKWGMCGAGVGLLHAWPQTQFSCDLKLRGDIEVVPHSNAYKTLPSPAKWDMNSAGVWFSHA